MLHFSTDQSCLLYAALVGTNYDPNGSLNNDVHDLNYKCFTSWHFQSDITHEVISASSTSDLSFYSPNNSINGFYVPQSYTNIFLRFTNTNQPNAWIQYDFGKVVQIQKLVVRTIWFWNFSVEARVSNQSQTGDFTSSMLFASCSNQAVTETMVLEGQNPVWGRYISVQSTGQNHMAIPNINIIGRI